jgi:hypothetical protein
MDMKTMRRKGKLRTARQPERVVPPTTDFLNPRRHSFLSALSSFS